MPDPEPLTATEIEERRQNLAFIRKNYPEGDHQFTTTLIMQEQWLATIDTECQRAERAEAQIEEMRREACAAVGTLENIFNGLTSPEALNSGISGKLAQEMAGAVADTLATAERCEHEAQVERLRKVLKVCADRLEGLGATAAREIDDALAASEEKP